VTEAAGNGGWIPEFPGQRPPFPPGHEITMIDGHRSERRVGPLAAQIVQDLLADPDIPGHLREPLFQASVQAWAHSEAVCALLRRWLADQDITAGLEATTTTDEEEETRTRGKTTRTTRKGNARSIPSVLETLRRYETLAMNQRRQLGLDPASAARVGRDLAVARRLDIGATPLDEALAEIQRRRELTAGEQ
jgi:hypothetical protein